MPPVWPSKHGTGYTPDERDPRDFPFAKLMLGGLSTKYSNSLLRHIETVRNQRSTESCVLQAASAAHEIRARRRGGRYAPISVLYCWFNARAAVGAQLRNVGCSPRIAMRLIQKLGGSLESAWSFSTDPIKFRRRPPWNAYAVGFEARDLRYYRIDDGDRDRQVRTSIDAGIPVMVGLEIGKEFKAHNGCDPLGPPTDTIGRHMVLVTGYEGDNFQILNSWGKGWGRAGVGIISRRYLEEAGTRDLYAFHY
jgi:hypothetical protein